MSLAKALKGTSASIILRFPTYDDTEVYVCLRILSALEDLSCFKAARATASTAGITQPKDSDPEYNLALQAEILYTCTELTENVGTKEEPQWKSTGKRAFSSPSEIMENLDQDRLHIMYQAYQTFRTACGKQISEITPETLASYLNVMGDESRGDKEAIPFLSQYKPGLQYQLARITAALARTVLVNSSGTGSVTTPEAGQTTQDG